MNPPTRSPIRTIVQVALLALAPAWSGCKDIPGPDVTGAGADGPPAAGARADTITIAIQDFSFRAPNGTDSLTIALGQTVRFVNLDAAPHTATSTQEPAGAPRFDSGSLSTGDVYHWTPAGTGTWVYRCDFHPVQMSGAILRVADGGAGDDGSGGGDVPGDTTGTGGDPDVTGDTILVEVIDFAFRTPNGTEGITLQLGQTVRFVNRGRADHTATSTSGPAGGFDSGNLEPGQVYHWTPGEAGDWTYICEYHDQMTGAFHVVGDSTAGDGDGDGDGDPGELAAIDITDAGFVGPGGTADVTIAAGQTVEWVNRGTVVHTASATKVPDGATRFDSGELAPGATYRFTPDRTGVWEYRCDEHSDEEGTITVR